MAVDISIDADLAGFLRRIEGLSEAASDEAREIARAFDRGLSSISSNTSRVTSEASTDFAQLGTVAEKALKKMGSAGNEVADVLFDFAGPLAEISTGLGGVGLAAAAAAGALTAMGLAAAGVVAGMVSITSAAADARDRLTEAGLAAEIPGSATQSLDRYGQAQGDLQTAVDRLVIKIADDGGLIDAVTGLTVATTGLVVVVDTSVGWVTRLSGAVVDLAGYVAPLVSVFDPVTGKMLAATAAAGGLYDQLQLIGSDDTAGTAIQNLITDLGKLDAAQIEAAFNASKIHYDDGSTDLDFLQRLAQQTDKVAKSTTEAATATGEANSKFRELDDTLRKQLDKSMPATQGHFEGITHAAIDTAETIRALTEDELAKIRDLSLGVVQDVSDGIGAITDAIIANYERRANAGEELSQKEKNTANALAIAAKAAAISQLAINAVVYWFQLTRDLALIPGNAAGAPFEAAGIVLAGMIAPAAQILGEPIPFPGGGGGGTPNGSAADPVDSDDVFGGNNYKDEGNSDSRVPGFVGSGKTSRSSNGQYSVVVSVTPARGLGKIQFSGVR